MCGHTTIYAPCQQAAAARRSDAHTDGTDAGHNRCASSLVLPPSTTTYPRTHVYIRTIPLSYTHTHGLLSLPRRCANTHRFRLNRPEKTRETRTAVASSPLTTANPSTTTEEREREKAVECSCCCCCCCVILWRDARAGKIREGVGSEKNLSSHTRTQI